MSRVEPFTADDVTFKLSSGDEILDRLDELHDIYRRTGALVFPGLLNDDSLFEAFADDIIRFIHLAYERAGRPAPATRDLSMLITDLASTDRDLVGDLYAFGTRPNKFLTGMALRVHPAFRSLLERLFGREAIVAIPSLSDTLHVFPPEAARTHNLPKHQDYPYLMQSERQVTFWINLTDGGVETGGIRVWLGSHVLGPVAQTKNEYGHLEVALDDETLSTYTTLDIMGQRGDLAVMDTHLVHQSLPNISAHESRVTQLFRFSDISDPKAAEWHWRSSETNTKGVAFADYYPELQPGAAD